MNRITQFRAYEKTGGICIVCGRPLSRHPEKWSVDHFIPRAIYKWVPGKKITRILESDDNLFIVHPHCNFRKGSALPTNQLISSLHAEENVKESMRKLYKTVEPKVIQYRAIKQSTLDSQHRRCGNCGRSLALNDAVLRRINDEGERVRENAICLCERCNKKICSRKRKQKMAAKIGAASGLKKTVKASGNGQSSRNARAIKRRRELC